MINKHLAGVLIIIVTSLFSQSSFASTYDFSRTFTGRTMQSYSSTWVEETETLSLSSTWNPSANIDNIQFLLSDGGSPWLDPTEQFLFYDLDLISNQVNIYTYHGRNLIETHNNILNITANGFSFSLDHTLLNQMTFGSRSFNGAGFTDDIGIWYYMYSNGNRVETYDIHHAATTKTVTRTNIPEPTTAVLLGLGLLGMAMRKFKAKDFFSNLKISQNSDFCSVA